MRVAHGCLLAVLLAAVTVAAASGSGDPDSLAHTAAWVSSNTESGAKATDGDDATFWQSGSCGGWYARASRTDNAVYGACAEGHCTSSCLTDKSATFGSTGSAGLAAATDGNAAYTAAQVRSCSATGRAWLTIQLPVPSPLRHVYVRGSFPAPNGTLLQATTVGGDTVTIGVLTPADQWQPRMFDTPTWLHGNTAGPAAYNASVAALHLRSYSDGVQRGYCYGGTGECMRMTVTEVAAQPQACTEHVTLDYGRVVAASHLRLRVTGHASWHNATLLRSFDGRRWSTVVPQLDALEGVWGGTTRLWATPRVMTPAGDAVLGRWWRVVFGMNEDPDFSTVKVSVWEAAMAVTPDVNTSYDAATLAPTAACFNDTAVAGAPGAVPCSGAGACVNRTCQCMPGFTGPSCNMTQCMVQRDSLGLPASGDGCGPHGMCSGSGACECDPWYAGTVCERFTCPRGCGGNGVCVARGTCQCHAGYHGEDCRFIEMFPEAGVSVLDYHSLLSDDEEAARRHAARIAPPLSRDADPGTCPDPAQPVDCGGSYGCVRTHGECSIKRLSLSLDTALPTPDNSSIVLEPLTAAAGVAVSASSRGSASETGPVVDGDTRTPWHSGVCLGGNPGFAGNRLVNGLVDACTTPGSASCTASEVTSALDRVTNGDLSGGSARVRPSGASGGIVSSGAPPARCGASAAWLRLAASHTPVGVPGMPGAVLAAVSVRTGGGDDDVSVFVETGRSAELVFVGNVTVPRRYSEVVLPVPTHASVPGVVDGSAAWVPPEWRGAGYAGVNATAVVLCSTTEFTLFEVAAMAAPCQEFVTVDLGAPTVVGTVSVRHTAGLQDGEVALTVTEVTADNPAFAQQPVWTSLHKLAAVQRPVAAPEQQVTQDIALRVPTSIRAIRVRHVLAAGVSAAVRVYEVTAWGVGGRYGMPQGNTSTGSDQARGHPVLPELDASLMPRVPLGAALGVNGIWGFGGAGWSNLAGDGWGPHRFSFASHGRNYENWLWNVRDPDTVPNFAGMACGGGTDAQWWLNWDWEYAGWVNAGMEVQASLQFIKSQWGESIFDTPYMSAYRYGRAYAHHFGPTHGTGLVRIVEVGNEPWYYGAELYSAVLLGMARGIKAGDPAVKVLPGSLESLQDYAQAINSSHLEVLDGVQIHAYAWVGTTRGRTGTHPEDPASGFGVVLEQIRYWRTAAGDRFPLYLSEYGWDAPGGGESCVAPECVSEHSQAVYAVRASLMALRWGLVRASWFFYGNIASDRKGEGVFSRSGLVSSVRSGHMPKQALHALNGLVDTLGPRHFIGVLQEDDNTWAYMFGSTPNPAGACPGGVSTFRDTGDCATHVVMWRPVPADDASGVYIKLQVSSSECLAPGQAWILAATDVVPTVPPTAIACGTWDVRVTSSPTVVAIDVAATDRGLLSVLARPMDPSTELAGCGVGANAACSGHGMCVDDRRCVCQPSWRGVYCELPTCPNACWNHGVCQDDGTCTCWKSFNTRAGVPCTERTCPATAIEYDDASDCELPKCPGAGGVSCSGHGMCTLSEQCVCDDGWHGTGCELAPCPFSCRQHGTCGADSTCTCDTFVVEPALQEYSYVEFQDTLEQFALDGDDNTRETGTDSGTVTPSTPALTNSTGTSTAAFVGNDCHWQHLTDMLSAPDGCQAHSDTPWQCPDGTCVSAMGECVLRAWEAAGGEGASTGRAWSLAEAVASNAHGLVAESYTQSPLASTHASSGDLSAYKATDGNPQTSFWSSTQCYPAYYGRADTNVLLRSCERSWCSASSSDGSTVSDGSDGGLALVTDGIASGTGATVGVDATGGARDGTAWVNVNLSSPDQLIHITARLSTIPASGVSVLVVPADGGPPVSVASLSASQAGSNVELVLAATAANGVQVSGVLLQATGVFAVTELAALSAPCAEWLVVDFGALHEVGALAVRHYANSNSGTTVASTSYQLSVDGVAWTTVAQPNPGTVNEVDVEVAPPVEARFVRVVHTLIHQAQSSVWVWEVNAWDRFGRFGPRPAAVANPVPLQRMLGVNGLWGWGTNRYSTLTHEGKPANTTGPLLYSFFGHARNYHNWHWDARYPEDAPDYEHMATAGHNGRLNQDWLNWDREYKVWGLAGLEVIASLQFIESVWPESDFATQDPVATGANAGFNFARHFGPSNGTGDVTTLEVGNEPWRYTDELYAKVFRGMASGAKRADPRLKLLPSAFDGLPQAGARLDASHLRHIDGVQVHVYSWSGTDAGRTGVRPEAITSSFNELNEWFRMARSLLKLGNGANDGNLPVYVSEWGWDAAGGGATCDDVGPECVSERAQAMYAVRGALLCARMGAYRASWFFFADLPPADDGVFSRSGLTTGVAAGSVPKQSYRALAGLVTVLGASHFLGALAEGSAAAGGAWAHTYGSVAGSGEVVTHVVAWLPLDGDDTALTSVELDLGSIVPALHATHAWRLGDVPVETSLPTAVAGVWTMQLGAAPLVIPAQVVAEPELSVVSPAVGVAAAAGTTLSLAAHSDFTVAWNVSGVSSAARVTAQLVDTRSGSNLVLATVALTPDASLVASDVAAGVSRASGAVLARDRRATWRTPDVSTLLPADQLDAPLALRLSVVDPAVTGSGNVALAVARSRTFTLLPAVQWAVSDWSACSVTCDAGVQTRDVVCVQPSSGGGAPTVVATTSCQRPGNTQPVATRSCFLRSCAAFGWRVGDWAAECTAACGGGTRTRAVDCLNDQGAVVSDTSCPQPKPTASQACNVQACDSVAWHASPWSACTVSCTPAGASGPMGAQYRNVRCRSSRGLPLPHARCLAALPGQAPPQSWRSCGAAVCPEYTLSVGAWSACSAQCDGGVRQRNITCMQHGSPVALSACAHLNPPAQGREQVTCNTRACDTVGWVTTAWSPCSAECGPGNRTRAVTCVKAGSGGVDNAVCTGRGLTQPPASQQCLLKLCDVCSDAVACHGREESCTAAGGCVCQAGWTGPRCGAPIACVSGVTDAGGVCCTSGVLNATGACCATTAGAVPSVDHAGACCPSGTVDACGRCDGSVNATLDVRGQCCDGGVVDEMGVCCSHPDGLDSCQVCGGTDTCVVEVDLLVQPPNGTGVTDADTAAWLSGVAGAVVEVLGVPDIWVTASVDGEAAAGARRLAAGSTPVTVTVTPELQSPGLATGQVHQRVEAGVARDGLGTGVESVSAIARGGVCGNGVCESGERCEADAGAGGTCCPADCPFVALACPTNDPDAACSGHGLCVMATGTCDCFGEAGYGGGACNECLPGYQSRADGGCVWAGAGLSACAMSQWSAWNPPQCVQRPVDYGCPGTQPDPDDTGRLERSRSVVAAPPDANTCPPLVDVSLCYYAQVLPDCGSTGDSLPSWVVPVVVAACVLAAILAVATAYVLWRTRARSRAVGVDPGAGGSGSHSPHAQHPSKQPHGGQAASECSA